MQSTNSCVSTLTPLSPCISSNMNAQMPLSLSTRAFRASQSFAGV